jgi:hypothetical protein
MHDRSRNLLLLLVTTIVLTVGAALWLGGERSSASVLCDYGDITLLAYPAVSSLSDGGIARAYELDAISSNGGRWETCQIPFTGYWKKWLANGVPVSGPTWVPSDPNSAAFTYVAPVGNVGTNITTAIQPCNAELCYDTFVPSSNWVPVYKLYLGNHWYRPSGTLSPTIVTHLDTFGVSAFQAARADWNASLGSANISFGFVNGGSGSDGTGPCTTNRLPRQIPVCQEYPNPPTTSWYAVTIYSADANGHFLNNTGGDPLDANVGIIVNRGTYWYQNSANFRRGVACHELGHALGVGHREAGDLSTSCMHELVGGQNFYAPGTSDVRIVRDVIYSAPDPGHNPGVHKPPGSYKQYARVHLGPNPSRASLRLLRRIQAHKASFREIGLPASLDSATVLLGE